MKFEYPAVLRRREDGRVEARFPDIEGLYAVGADEDHAAREAIEALRDYIRAEMDSEEPDLPPISDIDEIAAEEGASVRRIAAIVRFTDGWDE